MVEGRWRGGGFGEVKREELVGERRVWEGWMRLRLWDEAFFFFFEGLYMGGGGGA